MQKLKLKKNVDMLINIIANKELYLILIFFCSPD